ncbi:MAG TPA: alpha/beta hydrolase-fold protein, partial [Actinomycetota bacterium]
MKPWRVEPRGRFEQQTIRSRALEGNPLGDPVERPLWVYLPPGVGDDPGRRHPSIYVIQGYTGQVDMWWNRTALRPTVPELIDELFARPETPPAVVVLVDCWTSLGGSQFLNSPGTGRYLDYLCDEVVAFVDDRYPTLPAREHRGIAGKSSGGYGAMVAPMLRPDTFGALASHAGDALFEHCYLPDMAAATRALRDHYDGSYERFFADFATRPAMSKEADGVLLGIW